MRNQYLSISTLVLLISTLACSQSQDQFSPNSELNTLIDSASYVVGFQTGNQLYSRGFDEISAEKYVAGFLTALEEEEIKIDNSEITSLFTRLNAYLIDKDLVENKAEEEAFFADNRNKEGVIETDSGLQYKIIREGNGAKPFAQNKVSVMYEGRLIDGSIFDTNYNRGTPSEFVVGQVIQDWIESPQLMSIGSEFEFYIPNSLAYGENPRPGGIIKPGDALIFKVELLDIVQ